MARSLAADRDPRGDARRAKPEAVAGALGNSLQVAFECWQEWASGQRDFIVNGKPGVTEDEYEAVARRFAAVGIMPPGSP